MERNKKVDILMATYNGEKFISEQIESIINQTYENWRLLIRDDGSTDNTIDIIKKHVKNDGRIKLIQDNKGNLGIVKNFEELINLSEANYIMFSDQDDVWIKNKVELLYNNIISMEKTFSVDKPILVHSDAYITDENLNIISNNFIGRRAYKKGLNNLLFAACVQGASMIMNRKLKKIILPFPNNIHLHDYYISLVCEMLGERKFISDPLMFYRQHDENVVGASKGVICKLKKVFNYDFYLSKPKEKDTVNYTAEKVWNQITERDKIYLNQYKYISNCDNSKLSKFYKVLKYRYRASDGILALLFKILFDRKINDVRNK